MRLLIGRIVLGILLALLVLLAILLSMTLRVRAVYDRGDAGLWAGFGPLKIQIYPPKPQEEKKKKRPKKKKKKPEEPEEKKEKKKLSISAEQILYALETLPPILGRALGRFGRGIRVKPLKVHLLIAGEDPAGTALLYGRVQAALAAGMPVVRKLVRIQEEDIGIFLDFQQTKPDCIAEVGISIRCWTVVGIALRAGGSLVKWFFGFRKLSPPKAKPAEEEKQQQETGAA